MKYLRYYTGIEAENLVIKKYITNGFKIISKRFRSKEGEIDIIAQNKNKYYFIEVKKGKDFLTAAENLHSKQIKRIQKAALYFLQSKNLPLETDMRFDLALVNYNREVNIIPNAFAS